MTIELFLDKDYNMQNVLTYFEKYGSIREWKIVDHGRTFLLHFDDYTIPLIESSLIDHIFSIIN